MKLDSYAIAALSALALAAPAAPAVGAEAAVTLKATPLGRAQVAAFFGARGFSAAALEPYAAACVLSFALRNEGTTDLRFRLAEWTAGEGLHFVATETWENSWAQAGVAEPARLAFRWAQFPAEQDFAPGDWIMGMAALERRPAGPFRITARYADEKGQHELLSEPVTCAD